MTKITTGAFLSDMHMPDNIDLNPVFQYIKDIKPNKIILGGDIIDVKELHGVDSMKAERFKMKWYERDKINLQSLFFDLKKFSPGCDVIFLEGNHEERYTRLTNKYSDLFPDVNLKKDCGEGIKWIEYGTYKSYYRLGDTVFMHGTAYPDNHSKRYALDHTPFKCIYGHLHHFQAYTTRKAFSTMGPRYAVTAGCLSRTMPEWKKGSPNQWVNGFISFIKTGASVIPTIHMMYKNKFYANGKLYQ